MGDIVNIAKILEEQVKNKHDAEVAANNAVDEEFKKLVTIWAKCDGELEQDAKKNWDISSIYVHIPEEHEDAFWGQFDMKKYHWAESIVSKYTAMARQLVTDSKYLYVTIDNGKLRVIFNLQGYRKDLYDTLEHKEC